jgi:hypothetical protein
MYMHVYMRGFLKRFCPCRSYVIHRTARSHGVVQPAPFGAAAARAGCGCCSWASPTAERMQMVHERNWKCLPLRGLAGDTELDA